MPHDERRNPARHLGVALVAGIPGTPTMAGVEVLVGSWQNHRLLRYDPDTGAYLGHFSAGGGLFLPNDLPLRPGLSCRPDLTTSAGPGSPGVRRAQRRAELRRLFLLLDPLRRRLLAAVTALGRDSPRNFGSR